MAAAVAVNRTSERTPLSALARWNIAALIGATALFVFAQVVLVRGFDPPFVLMFGLPALILAVLMVVIRRRWAPVLGPVFWLYLLGTSAPYIAHDLSHPEQPTNFSFATSIMLPTLLGLVAGMAALVQNYRSAGTAERATDRPRSPRWFAVGVGTLVGLCVGAALVALASPAGAGAGISPEALAGLPVVSAANTRFDQKEIRVKAGDTVALRLQNNDSSDHSFDVDEFNVHVPIVRGKPGLAFFKATMPGTYTFYCSVPGHREAGMVGTLIVEP